MSAKPAINEYFAEEAVANALAWNNIRDFIIPAFSIVSPADEYSHNWHIDCICEHLHALHEGDIKRLIINIPPRSMKSITCTVGFPAWLLGKDPSTRIITASYGQKLATKHSVDTRLIMESGWYNSVFPETVIASDQNEKANFMTTKRGYRKATSVGGALTGEGGDFLILDDPMKPDEATSETIRNNTLDWIDQVFMSRLNNPKESRVLLVEQRLHTNDATGHLLNKVDWFNLKIPARAHKKVQIELKGQEWLMQEGDILHEDRLDNKTLESIRNQIGDYAFAGQYLQEPVPPSGAEFKLDWFTLYTKVENHKALNLYMFVDPAGDKKKTTSDYTAIMLWGLGADKNYYLIDMVRDRLNTTERVNKIFDLQRKYSQLTGKPVKVFYKSRSFIPELHSIKERMQKETYHFPLIEVMEKGEKNDRIRRMIAPAQQKRMYIPKYLNYIDSEGRNRDLTREFLEQEIALFPVAAHDDMLDATSELFNNAFESEISFPAFQTPKTGSSFQPPKNIWDM